MVEPLRPFQNGPSDSRLEHRTRAITDFVVFTFEQPRTSVVSPAAVDQPIPIVVLTPSFAACMRSILMAPGGIFYSRQALGVGTTRVG